MPLKIAVGSATITHRSCPFSRTCLGTRSKVVGIGTVDFPTKISPTQTGPSSHGVLHLKKVLHAPSIICNIIGQPLLDDCNVLTSFSESSLGSSGSITNLSDGRSVAYFNPLNRGTRCSKSGLAGFQSAPSLGHRLLTRPRNT
ncbi:hypothetical protein BDV23DRAFT_153679 [Aspergillus alliaceus]|uniref:Uncharacterized protein n=1 Tax=Petromyces alliaceus TaxID=209559 RepID=A0A5N7CAR5_PETAA|nr:hypothetical protein BDV23DRAFT_153679 [Aspergillus alliaceus]